MPTASKRAGRPALALLPTVGRIEPGRDAYVGVAQLRALAKNAPRWWTFHGMPTTVELDGRRYAKNITGFADHQSEAALHELIREYAEHGVKRPASYADVFHSVFRSPRVAYSINADLAPVFAGGWQEAIRPGMHRGTWHKYDMRSAYLWAGSLGMPDVQTYRRATTRSKNPGVYWCELEAPVPGAPYPFSRAVNVLATDDEIELYSLPVRRIVTGVTWTRLTDPAPMLDAIQRVSTWKQAGRAYWGRWGQSQRVECHTPNRSWHLPSFAANVPWAHLIVSRVKAKLWTHAARAVHVFVDSVITTDTIETGEKIGDWKLEHTYTSGIHVRAPGQYGPPGRKLDRMAGVPSGSPLREAWADANPELLAG